MKIEVIDDIERLRFYEAEWESILKEMNSNIMFLELDWIICWWKYFGDNHRLFVLVVVNDEKVVGICPLMVTHKGACKEIGFIGNRECLRMDFILRDEFREEALECICSFLRGLPGRNIIKLHGMAEESENYILLKEYIKANKVPFVSCFKIFYFFSLRDTDFSTYFEYRFGKRTRYTMNNKEKKLKELGNLAYTKIPSAEIDDVFEIHEKRWLRKIGNSSFSKGETKEFYKELASDKNKGFGITVDAMTLNNRIISFIYGIEYNKGYSAIRVAHDDDFYFLSPGELIFKKKIEECFSSGISVFDFGPGKDPYKAKWTDDYEKVFGTILPSDNLQSDLIFYLQYWIVTKLIDALKKSKIISSLRKYYLGKLKFFLSKTHISNKITRIKRAIAQNGLLPYVIQHLSNLGSKVISHKQYLVLGKYLKYVEISQSVLQVREAELEDIDALSEVMNEPASIIIRRFTNKHKCYLALHNNEIVFYCWINCSNIEISGVELSISSGNSEVHVYDTFLKKKYKNEYNYIYIFSSIFNLLCKKNYKRCYITLDSFSKPFEKEVYNKLFNPSYKILEKRVFRKIKHSIVDLKLGSKS